MKKLIMIPALLAVLVIVGCGGTETPAADNSMAEGTAKLEQQLEEMRAETERMKEQREAAAEATPEATPESKIEKAEREVENSGEKAIVPDVVGVDHQLAQDTMQAAGFYMLEEVDCTGQNRMLLLDRNWTVEEQKPAAGKKVSTESTITLCSVKDDE